jgi:hypothetical protein
VKTTSYSVSVKNKIRKTFIVVFWEIFGQVGFKVEKPAILNTSGDVRQQRVLILAF